MQDLLFFSCIFVNIRFLHRFSLRFSEMCLEMWFRSNLNFIHVRYGFFQNFKPLYVLSYWKLSEAPSFFVFQNISFAIFHIHGTILNCGSPLIGIVGQRQQALELLFCVFFHISTTLIFLTFGRSLIAHIFLLSSPLCSTNAIICF